MHVAVMGAGIIGCTAAALLAEAGEQVTVVERDAVAAGASGRNSGVLQHPLDPRLTELHAETLALQREVLDLAPDPGGILLVGATSTEGLPDEVAPELLEDASAVDPLLQPGLPAVRLHTGWMVGPAAVTQAWWRRAEAAGARLVAGSEPPPDADQVLLATGAATERVTPLWGVTARVRVRFPTRHVLEEAGVEAIVGGADGELFSLVGDVLGSSFSAAEPDVEAVCRRLEQRAQRFVGALEVTSARACPRPQTTDGLPRVGRIDPRTVVCAGHGSWGISIGPATARLAVRAMLHGDPVPDAFDPLRFGP